MDPISSKMSKSDPDSGISIHDSPEDIRRKIKKAFCPMEPEEADRNPVLMLCRYLVFERLGHLHIDRPEKFGGALHFQDMESLSEAYISGSLHPSDLKNGVSEALIEILAPVRDYFQEKPQNHARMLEILKKLGRY